MIELSTGFVEQVAAPPLAPVDQPVDVNHLARMTLGDRSLEHEVLQLFERQAGLLLARMRQSDPKAAGAFAHTLKGSALGIGAWRVAGAAEAVELAAATDAAEANAAIGRLGAAIEEARLVIVELLRAH